MYVLHTKWNTKNLAIVKLFIQFEKQNDDTAWAMATGWLIAADTVITAGHCAYDWGAGMKRAIKVKAYIGYAGKGKISDSSVQFSEGALIVTTSGWLSAEGHRESDVSFIQLKTKFTGNLNLIKYQGTPTTGSEKLGVVGYPADKQDPDTKERGAYMYEDFESVTWDLTTSFKDMLEYAISTYAGIFSSSSEPSLTPLKGILDPPFCEAPKIVAEVTFPLLLTPTVDLRRIPAALLLETTATPTTPASSRSILRHTPPSSPPQISTMSQFHTQRSPSSRSTTH
jgi:V8-like Glu-specific endopeptidase